MKTIIPPLREHLNAKVTALSTCWEVRRRDGKVLRFTDCDEDIIVENLLYLSIGAYSRTAIESSVSLAVDNLDISGITSELSLPATELRSGLFDHAQIFVFMTPWMAMYPGKLKMRRGFFGEVQVLPNNTFKVEMRGLMQRFTNSITEVYSDSCRYDFGSRGCGVAVVPEVFSTTKLHRVGDHVRRVQTDQITGERVRLKIGDPDFENLGVNGILNSHDWFDLAEQGAVDFVTTNFPYNGNFSGRSSLTGTLAQQIVIVDEDVITTAAIDSGDVRLTFRAFRRDVGQRGRMILRFLDSSGRSLREGGAFDNRVALVNRTIPEVALAGDFTIESWVYKDGLGGAILGNNSIGDRFGFTFDGNRPVLFHEVNSVVTEVIRASINAPAGWNHLAVTRSGTTTTLYLNGIARGQNLLWDGEVLIDTIFGGYGLTNNTASVQAVFAELRIWNIHRDAGEIRYFSTIDLPNNTANLLHYWPLTIDGDDFGSLNEGLANIAGTVPIFGMPMARVYRGPRLQQTGGYEDVGTTWVQRGPVNRLVPPRTRQIQIIFDGEDGLQNSFIDSPYGWLTNVATDKTYPEHFGNVFYTCTASGTGNSASFSEHDAYLRHAVVTSSTGNRVFTIAVTEPRAVDGWFDGGLVTMASGNNEGASMEIKSWTQSGSTVELFLSLPYPVEIGDLLTIYPGCDKSRVCCAALFNNITNFFGTPDVPGEDALFAYPDAK